MPRSVGEAIFLEADMKAHLAYYEDAFFLRNQYLRNRPRIDTGEDLVYLNGQLDALYEEHCRLSGMKLRKAEIDYAHPDLQITIRDFADPFPWEKEP